MNALFQLTIRIKSFLFGVTLPVRSFKLILSKPKLLTLSIAPVSITAVLYFFVIRSINSELKEILLHYLSLWGLDPNALTASMVVVLVKIIVVMVAALTFSFFANLVSVPFNDFLAEAAENHALPKLPETPQMHFFLRIKFIGIDGIKTIAAAFASLFALLGSWIPLVNVLAILVAMLLVSFQYLSYPQTRRGEGLAEGIRYLWQHKYSSLGFGFVTSALYAIPLISVFMLPLAVIGGTLLVAKAQEENFK